MERSVLLSEFQYLCLFATSCANTLSQMTLINLELCYAFSRNFTVNTKYLNRSFLRYCFI